MPVHDVIYVCSNTIIYKSVIYNLGVVVKNCIKIIESLENNAVFPVGQYIFHIFFFLYDMDGEKKNNNANIYADV